MRIWYLTHSKLHVSGCDGEKYCLIIFNAINTFQQGRNQLFISGEGNFHELSFDDVIVLIQPWYNFFANGHRYVLFATFPKMRTN